MLEKITAVTPVMKKVLISHRKKSYESCWSTIKEIIRQKCYQFTYCWLSHEQEIHWEKLQERKLASLRSFYFLFIVSMKIDHNLSQETYVLYFSSISFTSFDTERSTCMDCTPAWRSNAHARREGFSIRCKWYHFMQLWLINIQHYNLNGEFVIFALHE